MVTMRWQWTLLDLDLAPDAAAELELPRGIGSGCDRSLPAKLAEKWDGDHPARQPAGSVAGRRRGTREAHTRAVAPSGRRLIDHIRGIL
jgi:hypothetical protein